MQLCRMLARICTERQATAPKTVKLVEPPPTTSVVDSGKPAFHRFRFARSCVDVTLVLVDTGGTFVGIVGWRYGEVLWLGSWRKKEKFLGSKSRLGEEEGKVVWPCVVYHHVV